MYMADVLSEVVQYAHECRVRHIRLCRREMSYFSIRGAACLHFHAVKFGERTTNVIYSCNLLEGT